MLLLGLCCSSAWLMMLLDFSCSAGGVDRLVLRVLVYCRSAYAAARLMLSLGLCCCLTCAAAGLVLVLVL